MREDGGTSREGVGFDCTHVEWGVTQLCHSRGMAVTPNPDKNLALKPVGVGGSQAPTGTFRTNMPFLTVLSLKVYFYVCVCYMYALGCVQECVPTKALPYATAGSEPPAVGAGT